MKLGMWTSFPHQNPGETSKATCCRHYIADSLGSQPCGAGAARGNGRVGGGLVLTLSSPDGRARARGSMPQGGEQRCQEMLISQD